MSTRLLVLLEKSVIAVVRSDDKQLSTSINTTDIDDVVSIPGMTDDDETKLNQYDLAWERKYQLFLNYYKIHENCLVPASYPNLGRWVQQHLNTRR